MTESVFTAAYDREARVSPDRQRIRHTAGAWSAEYNHERFLFWQAWYTRKAEQHGTAQYRADAEVLRAARDLLVKEGVLT